MRDSPQEKTGWKKVQEDAVNRRVREVCETKLAKAVDILLNLPYA